jgi:hypothetical protein
LPTNANIQAAKGANCAERRAPSRSLTNGVASTDESDTGRRHARHSSRVTKDMVGTFPMVEEVLLNVTD